MTINTFNNLVENPQTIEEQNFVLIKEIVKHFPFFTSARILQLKLMSLTGHFDFNSSLKLTSIYSHDRSKLFELINHSGNEIESADSVEVENNLKVDETELETKIAEPAIESNVEKVADVLTSSDLVDSSDYLHQLIEQRLNEMKVEKIEVELPIQKIEIIEPKQEFIAEPEMIEADEEILISENIELKTQNIFEQKDLQKEIDKIEIVELMESSETEQTDSNESKSFLSWLATIGKNEEGSSAPSSAPVADESVRENVTEIVSTPENEAIDEIDLTVTEISKKSDTENQNELIDTFLEAMPRIEIKKAEFYSPINMARKSVVLNDDIISETLADIFVKQQLYDKAENAYEKLSLKFPEKKVLFAARIEKIKALIKSNK